MSASDVLDLSTISIPEGIGEHMLSTYVRVISTALGMFGTEGAPQAECLSRILQSEPIAQREDFPSFAGPFAIESVGEHAKAVDYLCLILMSHANLLNLHISYTLCDEREIALEIKNLTTGNIIFVRREQVRPGIFVTDLSIPKSRRTVEDVMCGRRIQAVLSHRVLGEVVGGGVQILSSLNADWLGIKNSEIVLSD